jgi:hypothetical protein
MSAKGRCHQGVRIGLVVVGVLLVAVNARATKHDLPAPLPPEMKTQPQKAPPIPTPPGEQKQLEKPQPPQKVDPSRPVMKQIERPALDQVKVVALWTEPAQPINGQRIKVKMRISNLGTSELRNVRWRMYKTSGPGQFDSGVQSVPAIGPAPHSATVEGEWLATLGSHRFIGLVDMPGEIVQADNTLALDVTVGPRTISRQLIAQSVGGEEMFPINLDPPNRPPGCIEGKGYSSGNPEFSIRCGPGSGWRARPQIYKGAATLKNGWVVSDVKLRLPYWADSSYRLGEWITRPQGTSLFGELRLVIDPLDPNRRSPVGGQVEVTIKGPENTNPF